MRHGTVAEYRGKFLVELRECAPQRALKRLVRAGAEMAGKGQCRLREQIPEVLVAELEPQYDQGEAEHSGYGGVRNAERMMRHGDLLPDSPTMTFPSIEGRMINYPGVRG
jgi:hypothetical protein